MADNTLTIEKVVEAVTPLERKYGWNAQVIEEGKFVITITDGNHEAKGEITSLGEIEELVRELEKQVDGQDYATIG